MGSSQPYVAGSTWKSSWPLDTGLPFSARIFTILPRHSDLISFMTFMASTMQRVPAASMRSPSLTKGGDCGEEER
ncbi:MAG: hypothetical protein A2636_06730 [Elusimicrobia bacterium RIFCSPHIGHO2_01_FULL_64_10]|nr:MAG: hypothetical protein A2636_06730 [Elusimicrobia bacterium RIFCSPHIGHO2_01_FULL_64_10]